MKENLTVHGSILFLLKKYVDQSLPYRSWEQLLAKANLKDFSFELTKAYPLDRVEAIMIAASEHTSLPVEKLKEDFGEHMVPALFQMYKHYLQREYGWQILHSKTR